jgi:hypothetical protein
MSIPVPNADPKQCSSATGVLPTLMFVGCAGIRCNLLAEGLVPQRIQNDWKLCTLWRSAPCRFKTRNASLRVSDPNLYVSMNFMGDLSALL